MKKKLLLFLLIFCSFFVNAQNIEKFKAVAMFQRYYDEESRQWEEWGNYEEISSLFVIDINKHKISLYANWLVEYEIFDVVQLKEFDGITFKCFDDKNIYCEISILNYEGELQIYIAYKYYQLGFTVHRDEN